MKLYCDNKSTINIAHNMVQYDCTKYEEIDKHFIKGKLDCGLIWTSYVSIRGQLANILIERLANHSFYAIGDKLGIENIYFCTRKSVEKSP